MTEPDITVRPMRPEEKARVRTIMRRAFSLTIHPFFSFSDHVLVADRDGEPVGAVVLEMFRLPDRRRAGEIAWIFTDPEARGLGAGQALVEGALRYLDDGGCDETFAIVEGNNSSSAKLFATRGFSVLSPGAQFRRYGVGMFLVWVRTLHVSDIGHFLWARPPARDADRPVGQWWGGLLLHLLLAAVALWRRGELTTLAAELGPVGAWVSVALGLVLLLGGRQLAMRTTATLRGLSVRYRAWESTFPTTLMVAVVFGGFFPAPGGLYPEGHDWRYDDLLPKLGPMGLAGSLTVLLLTWGAWALRELAGLAPALQAGLGSFLVLAVPLSLFDTIFAVFPFNGFNGRRLWDWNRPLWLLLSLAAAAILFV